MPTSALCGESVFDQDKGLVPVLATHTAPDLVDTKKVFPIEQMLEALPLIVDRPWMGDQVAPPSDVSSRFPEAVNPMPEVGDVNETAISALSAGTLLYNVVHVFPPSEDA
jgi:hypothetical protein